MTRLIYRYVNDTLKLVRAIDESSTHYYWIDQLYPGVDHHTDELQRDAKTNWSEVPDSAYVDVTDACDFDMNGRLAVPECRFDSTRVVKKRDKAGNTYFVVEQIDVDKLPKRKS